MHYICHDLCAYHNIKNTASTVLEIKYILRTFCDFVTAWYSHILSWQITHFPPQNTQKLIQWKVVNVIDSQKTAFPLGLFNVHRPYNSVRTAVLHCERVDIR